MGQKTAQVKKRGGCLRGCLMVLLTVVVVFGIFVYFATGNLRRSDEAVLKAYQPSAEVAEIAEKTALADRGKATLYRSEPTFVDADAFVKYCLTRSRGVESLACNVPKPGGGPFGGRQIFLLKIDDPRFADHKYPAAVHEMLHTAYQRLSSGEKKRINALLDQELARHQDDAHLNTIIQTLKEKKANDARAVYEELHSKFGVEYADLLPELEEYYKEYFNDRVKVVELFKSGGFNSRVRQLDELNFELGELKSKGMVEQYNLKVSEAQRIYSEIQEFYKYFNPDYSLPQGNTQ